MRLREYGDVSIFFGVLTYSFVIINIRSLLVHAKAARFRSYCEDYSEDISDDDVKLLVYGRFGSYSGKVIWAYALRNERWQFTVKPHAAGHVSLGSLQQGYNYSKSFMFSYFVI